jgi:hypothetical protein
MEGAKRVLLEACPIEPPPRGPSELSPDSFGVPTACVLLDHEQDEFNHECRS